MSDGPEQTLKMDDGWRRVAKSARLDAYVPSEIADQMWYATAQWWRAQVQPGLLDGVRAILGDGRQGSLFEDQRLRQLEQLRLDVRTDFERVLIDCALQAVAEGLDGTRALHEAVKHSLRDKALRGCRQVEGHFLVTSSDANATHIRQRLATARDACDFSKLTMHVLGEGPDSTKQSSATQAGVDEGPRL